MVEDGVDVVDDVGPAPEVSILKGLAAVEDVLRVTQHHRAAVGARVVSARVVLVDPVERPLRGAGQRLEDRGPGGQGHFE